LQKDDNFRGGRLVFECGEMKINKTIWEDGFRWLRLLLFLDCGIGCLVDVPFDSLAVTEI
jgi:hypothetical protein